MIAASRGCPLNCSYCCMGAGSDLPYRIDLLDDEIDTLRTFDPESQRTIDRVEAIELLPAREYPCDPDSLEAFRKAFRYRFVVDTRKVALYHRGRGACGP